ncbi:hypothetical protein FRC02_009719 [Tulasnella sp. 418]|nr:hypothetical protein FRC02_009719 [Tulasnella sp. 418]
MFILSRKTGLIVAGVLLFVGGQLHVQKQCAGVHSAYDHDDLLSIPELRTDMPTMSDAFVKVQEEPETTILRHSAGYTVFDQLYMFNGTILIVSDRNDLPAIRMMTSSGFPRTNLASDNIKREPTDEHMQIITPSQARERFGHEAIHVKGVTFIINDPPQFVAHYFHFAAEIFFGMWRAYSSLDLDISANGKTSLPPLSRLVYKNVPQDKWCDRPRLNEFVIRSVFPEASMEFEHDWKFKASSGKAYVYDRVVFQDRVASFHENRYPAEQGYSNPAFSLPGSKYWWMPIRSNMLRYLGINPEFSMTESRPVITYISRQAWGRRSLKKEDHEALVAGLRKLEAEKGYEVHIAEAEKMSKPEQVSLASRTTIMMGVHGNGLTAQIWMAPTPKATVMEFFFPQGFSPDYAKTAMSLGLNYHGFWGSRTIEPPNLPKRAVPDPKAFQGNQIPLDANVVISLVEKILSSD